ncbi:hypothetical protein EXIGLDRAFT_701006 [Exidia glandulosa HHB12029]|uniref:Uncharacterized protein n=1 Tax=Exidia glandulosa HHB12029 TaxID=1314781 RepID=A0A165LY84_EXIGL|nr:hypothetical protein EXIGLDRAFT_701006 [Exidia glandulosa HHB12029]
MNYQGFPRDPHGGGNDRQGAQLPPDPSDRWDTQGRLRAEFQEQIRQQLGGQPVRYPPPGYQYQAHQQQPSQGAGYPHPGSQFQQGGQGQMHPQMGGQGHGGGVGRGYAQSPGAPTPPYANYTAAQAQYPAHVGGGPSFTGVGAGAGSGSGHTRVPGTYSDNDMRIMHDSELSSDRAAADRRRQRSLAMAEGQALGNANLERQRNYERQHPQNTVPFREPAAPNFDPSRSVTFRHRGQLVTCSLPLTPEQQRAYNEARSSTSGSATAVNSEHEEDSDDDHDNRTFDSGSSTLNSGSSTYAVNALHSDSD